VDIEEAVYRGNQGKKKLEEDIVEKEGEKEGPGGFREIRAKVFSGNRKGGWGGRSPSKKKQGFLAGMVTVHKALEGRGVKA